MKDLTCGDLERQNKALSAADEFLKRHKAENDDDSDDEFKEVTTVSDRTDVSKVEDDTSESAFISGIVREPHLFLHTDNTINGMKSVC